MKQTPEALSVAEDARTAKLLSAPGYVQSKWVAERLLLRAVRADRTLSITLYRAGHVRYISPFLFAAYAHPYVCRVDLVPLWHWGIRS
jgi:hypothetical protein